MHNSDQEGQREEHGSYRFKDDMASRRTSAHIPAPLRKKKYEDHRKFITPTGNPVAYLQKHMRSKSLSDLNEEKREEEKHRAEINTRYQEMEKLKALLKEEEDTWTSKLQSWKKRRRSVTEDARKRKEERDSLEKEAGTKSGRRRTKTYKEIVEDKMKRDKELAQLNDRDEYEFVSPRSSTSGTELPIRIIHKTSQDLGSIPSASKPHIESMTSSTTLLDMDSHSKFSTTLLDVDSHPKKNAHSKEVNSSVSQESQSEPAVQYKYTTKVTAVINSPEKETDSQNELSVTISHPVVQRKPSSNVPNEQFGPTIPKFIRSQKISEPTQIPTSGKPSAWQHQQQPNSNTPRVLLRSKQPNVTRERPKSAHDLPSGSSTLPRSFRDYSTPKPFVPGTSNFMQYRRAAFANRRDMWENLSVPSSRLVSAEETPQVHSRNASDEVFSTDASMQKPACQSHPESSAYQGISGNSEALDDEIPKVSQRMRMFKSQHLKENSQHHDGSKRHYPPKVPLISDSQIHLRKQAPAQSKIVPVSDTGLTATLSTDGLSMTAGQVSKVPSDINCQKKPEAFFDDMKICINQRPRSEKGFGFTVRGGDDGKPVIVDTVSPGGAADICHLCVSDEILAINEVSLSDCKSQDDIVHLIVSSVITGNLSLNIRRYGKAKKSSPLRLFGTKVVMTPGGFVQVRSDKTGCQNSPLKTTAVPVFQKNIPVQSAVHTDKNNNDTKNGLVMNAGSEDLPPPPTVEELDAIGTTHSARRQTPLLNLITAASQNSSSEYIPRESVNSDTSESSFQGTALSEVYSSKSCQQDDEEELQWVVSEAHKALDFEAVQMPGRHDEQLRLKLEEEKKRLELEETQREEIRKRLQEEARLEDMKVQEELRKIQARKLKQQSERRKEIESLQKDKKSSVLPQYDKKGTRPNGPGPTTGAAHWMVEEAERRRVAEVEGKARTSALDYGQRLMEPVPSSALPARVIQHLTHRASRPAGPRPFVRNVVGSSSNA